MNTLEYIVKEPNTKTDNPPLLILLHGYGSNEQDLFSFANELPENLLIVSAKAPLALPFGGYAWYSLNFDDANNKFSDLDEAKQSVEKIVHFIDFIKDKYNNSKTFLLGFSQGAILSYAVSFLHPNKADHVIALSGYINKDLLPDKLPASITTDYFCSHGTVDQVLPVDWAREAQPFLNKHNLKNTYLEYNVGHGVAPQNFFDFKNWILKRL